MHCSLDLELKLHTLLDFVVVVRTFHIYIYIYRERERERERERTGSAGLLASVSASAVPYSRVSEERI